MEIEGNPQSTKPKKTPKSSLKFTIRLPCEERPEENFLIKIENPALELKPKKPKTKKEVTDEGQKNELSVLMAGDQVVGATSGAMEEERKLQRPKSTKKTPISTLGKSPKKIIKKIVGIKKKAKKAKLIAEETQTAMEPKMQLESTNQDASQGVQNLNADPKAELKIKKKHVKKPKSKLISGTEPPLVKQENEDIDNQALLNESHLSIEVEKKTKGRPKGSKNKQSASKIPEIVSAQICELQNSEKLDHVVNQTNHQEEAVIEMIEPILDLESGVVHGGEKQQKLARGKAKQNKLAEVSSPKEESLVLGILEIPKEPEQSSMAEEPQKIPAGKKRVAKSKANPKM